MAPKGGMRASKTLLGAVFCLLSGCVTAPGSGEGGYRDGDAPMGATTRFDPVRFSGDWVLVSGFGPTTTGRVAFINNAVQNTMTLSSDVIAGRAGVYDISGAGILTRQSNAEDTLIVMWVDEGFRTAAVGTENGDFGAILNRKSDIPADRAAAARQVLDFYGWDISKLQEATP